MTFLDWLRKLGILRFGVKKAVWHSGKDLPAEMLMEGVFNAEKDLVTKKDLSALTGKPGDKAGKARFCTGCGAKLESDVKFCAACGREV
jgi:hypothetical protein